MNIKQYLDQGIEFIPAVVGYLVDEQRVLLGLRKKVSFGLGQNIIAGIGGKLEGNETNQQALRREVQEEIGVDAPTATHMGRVRFIFPNKPKWNLNTNIYLINQWHGNPIETEPIKPMWFMKNYLPKSQMWEDNLLWLPEVLAGNMVMGTFLYNEQDKMVEHLLEVEKLSR